MRTKILGVVVGILMSLGGAVLWAQQASIVASRVELGLGGRVTARAQAVDRWGVPMALGTQVEWRASDDKVIAVVGENDPFAVTLVAIGYGRCRVTAYLVLPDGYRLASLPVDIEVVGAPASLRLTFSGPFGL